MTYKPSPHSIRIGIGMVFLLSGIPFANAATDCAAVTEIPKTQCEALVSLYNATVDPTISWNDNTGWNNTDTPCSWKGIDCATDTSNVINIDLSDNNLVGTLPSLSAFTELQSLKLNGNSLTGNFPDLTALTKLQVLNLSNNQFSGDLPASISNLTTLQILALNNNGFTGTIPDLKSLVDLKTLQLNDNQLEGTFPEGLKSLTNLQTIAVNNNTAQLCVDFTVDYGTLKDKLTSAPNNLIECNKCEGLVGAFKSQCETLFSLYKNTDGLHWSPKPTGWDDQATLCSNWQGIACVDGNVTEIDLTSHLLKGTLPNLSDLTYLQKLKLNSNQLSGKIPDLSALTALNELDLSDNQFNDLIPELNALINLVSLFLNGNQLEGPIPALDKLTLLTTLKLTTNAKSLCKDPTRVYGGLDTTITEAPNSISICEGKISGTKFNDLNDNGVKDAGEPGLLNQTVTAKNTVTNQEISTMTVADGAYTLTVPYGTYAITSNLDTNIQQQTIPVRNPPLTTPFGVEISWTKKDEKVNFGVHGKNALTLTKSLTNKDHSITATTTTPDSSNLSCDTTECTFYYFPGQVVELKAISNLVGSNFTEWTGDCATTDADNPTNIITMTSNKSCGVRFQNFSCSRIKEISPAECTALLALFDSTSGQFWDKSGGWRDTLTPCSTPWYGVTCDGGTVTAINLSSNDLLGSLPSDFSALSGLQTFDVSGNNGLTGTLPDSLTSISSLNNLKVSSGVCENLNGEYGSWDDKLGTIGLSSTACAPLPPVAAFNILPPKGTLTVDLVASGFDLDGDYLWTSSCGQTATGQKTSITFSKAVTCGMTLTVTDSAKNTITATQAGVVAPAILTVKKTAIDPLWEATLLPQQVNNLTVNLDAVLSTTTDGEIDSYNWTTSCGPTSTTGPITSITFLRAATCDITLTVKNKAGSSAPVTKTVIVPMASLIVTKTGESSGQVLMNPSNPVAADCFPEICASQQGNYFPGTAVQLTAKPYPGAIFTGWGGDCDDGSPVGGRLSILLDASVLSAKYPAGTTYHWTTSCSTTTDPTPNLGLTGTGVETSITLPESSTCDITLTVKNATGTVIGSPFVKTQVKVPVITPIAGAFQILPPRISIVVDEGAKNCTANFDLDPNMKPNLEVQLWDIKTNQQTESAGQIVDNRLTINVGDGYTKAKTYYEPGKRVKLRSIPNHVQKTNSGANTYWEFVRWECLDKNQQLPVILGSQTQKKPLLRFLMPTSYTICKAYFNSDQDIAGQELRKDFNTEGKGALDTGELPSERYPLDKGNNAARQREAMYWAQSAILTVESIIDMNNLDTTWSEMENNGLTDKEFFRPSAPGNEKAEGKEWTQSIKIRPKDAEVMGLSPDGSSSTPVTVSGHYVEVRVMLVNVDGVEEEVPILVYWGERPVTLLALAGDLPTFGGDLPMMLAFWGEKLPVSLLSGGVKRNIRKYTSPAVACVPRKLPPVCGSNCKPSPPPKLW